MFIFLIFTNVIYLILELVFNIYLLNIGSSHTDYSQIHSLEIFGRCLSSFGFTFIFWKIISNKNSLTAIHKIKLMALISVITYPLFFYGQIYLINTFSNNASSEIKQNSFALVLLKQGMQNGSVNIGFTPKNQEELSSPELKTFNILSGIMLLHNEVSLKFIKSNLDTISYTIFSKEAIKNSEKEYLSSIRNMNLEADNLWIKYDSSRKNLLQKQKLSSKILSDNFSKINADVKLSWSGYVRWQKRYGRVLNEYYDHSLEGDLMGITRCTSVSCYESILNHNDRMSVSGYSNQNGVKSSTFRMNRDVNMSRKFSKENVYNIRKICNEVQSNGYAYYNVLENGYIKNYKHKLKGDFLSGFQCKINRDEMKKDFLESNSKQIYNNMHTSNLNHQNINSYLNDKEVQSFFDSQSILKAGSTLPKPFPVNNYAKFKTLINSNSLIEDRLSMEIKKQYNVEFSKGINTKQQFINDPAFHQIIKNKLGENYFEGLNLSMKKEEFIPKYIRKYSENATKSFINEYQNSYKYSDNGNQQVKAIIIPPIALFLSLLFTIINFGILILSISKKVIKNKNSYNKIRIFMIFLILSLISYPIFVENNLTTNGKYHSLINTLKKENFLMSVAVDWTMRAEPLIFSTIKNEHYKGTLNE